MATPQYELVLFGATGYTGQQTAHEIVKLLPTDLRWALAGRSQSKLEALAAEIQELNKDRVAPGIETCSLDSGELDALVKKTKLLISTIGPYSVHGEFAFKACAENGTHYLDVTGELPWVARMIHKYEDTAKKSGSIMIPQIGVESAPADLVTYSLARFIKQEFQAKVKDVVFSIHTFKSGASGGTIASFLAISENYSLGALRRCFRPYALSPIPGPRVKRPKTLRDYFLGYHVDPHLGILTKSLIDTTDRGIVHRSWGLQGGDAGYGPKFSFNEYTRVNSPVRAVIYSWGISVMLVALATSLFRSFVRSYSYAPGEGPPKEQHQHDRMHYKGTATADDEQSTAGPAKRALCNFKFDGSPYHLTGILLALSALTIVRDDHTLPSGILTASMLGQPFIERLKDAGVEIDVRALE